MSSNYIGSSEEALAVLNSIHARDRLIVSLLKDIGVLRHALNLISSGSADSWAVTTATHALKDGDTHISHLPLLGGNDNEEQRNG